MADSSAIQSTEEISLLEAAMDRPFEPADVPLSPASSPTPSTSTSTPAPAPPAESSTPSTEEDNWQAAYDAHVNEWRSQSASTRTQAELTRAAWEAIRLREEEERKAHGQPPETWDSLGLHITADSKAATEIVASSLSASVTSIGSIEHVQHEEEEEKQEQDQIEEQEVQHGKTESGSPEHRWEHISSSQTSSYPSMSFPEVSAPQSPSPQRAALTSVPASSEPQQNPPLQHAPTRTAPSMIPSIMDNRVAPRTRTSLILSSLAINLLLPFINGVMLGFGEIFAKDVLLGWFGWKTHSGRTAANVGLRN